MPLSSACIPQTHPDSLPQANELADSSLIHLRCRRLLVLASASGGLISLDCGLLDVAKAHRRVLIRASDRGLLCCFAVGTATACFSASRFSGRVSSFYWARAAGLLLRFLKRLVHVRHSGLIYIDDLLSLVNRLSPVIVIPLLCLRVPGISGSFRSMAWMADGPPSVSTQTNDCSVRDLQHLTGKLFWLSCLFRCFRPSMTPLHSDQHSFAPGLTTVSPDF